MIDNFLEIKSIDPNYWGKSGWIFLNSMALTYKPEYKDKYRIFIEQLPWILPCRMCGDNLKKNLVTLDDSLESKEKFIKWLIDVRNDIYEENLRPQSKKNMKQTFDEIFYKNCDYSMHIYLCVLFISFIILIVIYKMMVNNKEE
jgi:hypothetical protein